MRQAVSEQSWSDRTRTYSVTEPASLFSTLVCLGAGALGATVLSVVSGTLACIDGTLVVRDERALAMAVAIGLIDVVLMGFFKANLFDERDGDASVLSLFVNGSGLGSRYFHRPVHFGSPEVRLLKQLARARQLSVRSGTHNTILRSTG